MSQDVWNSYFYPETLDERIPVMKNRFGIKDPEELHRVEHLSTLARGNELRQHPELVARTFDTDHLKAIHRHLFQDVYDWAGQIREVDIVKDRHAFAVLGAEPRSTGRGTITYPMQDYLTDAEKIIAETNWKGLNRAEFAEKISEVFSHVNHAHPFREGNGRTTKVFLQHIAEKTPFELSWNKVPAESWNQKSLFSAPQPGERNVNPDEILHVFRFTTTEREPQPKQAAHTPGQQRFLEQSAAYRKAHPPAASPTRPRDVPGPSPSIGLEL